MTTERLEELVEEIKRKTASEASDFLKKLYKSKIGTDQRTVLVEACESRIPEKGRETAIVVSSGFE